jgi:HEAT repeat protein/Mg-chelatase subunit ChlD
MLAHCTLLAVLLLPAVQDPLSDAEKALVETLAKEKTSKNLKALIGLADGAGDNLRKLALEASWEFRSDPGLKRNLIGFYADLVKSKDESTRRDAIFFLMRFGTDVYAELDLLVHKSKDDYVRAYALQTLLPRIKRSKTEQDLELVLDNCQLARTAPRPDLVTLLRSFDHEFALPLFERKLKKGKLRPEIETVILETLGDVEGEAAEDILRLGLRDKMPMVQHAALTAIQGRDIAPFATEINRLCKDSDRSIRAAALTVLLHGGPEDSIVSDPVAAALSKDPIVRWVAIPPLAEVGGDLALERLHGLVVDEERFIRAAARDGLVILHRRESIPVLIGALESERGLGAQRTIEALRYLSGVDHGRLGSRWSTWWSDVGESFEMPSKEAAHAAETERTRKRAENDTKASFYNLRIESERVCFVFDLSGSMSYKTADGRVRIDVAREELASALEAIADGSLVNVILFAAEPAQWKRGAQPLDAKGREQIMAFTKRAAANGGTDLHEALALAYEDPELDTIYLLTDGPPSEGVTVASSQVLLEIARWNATQRATIHTITVGGPSRLLQDIATQTGGTYTEAQ